MAKQKYLLVRVRYDKRVASIGASRALSIWLE